MSDTMPVDPNGNPPREITLRFNSGLDKAGQRLWMGRIANILIGYNNFDVLIRDDSPVLELTAKTRG